MARAVDANAKRSADGSADGSAEGNVDGIADEQREDDEESDALWSGEPHPMCVVRAEAQVWARCNIGNTINQSIDRSISKTPTK